MGSNWQERAAGPDAHDTRGKTAPQRLRRLDQFLLAFEPGLLSSPGATVVGLGYGRAPITTIEWFERLRAQHPRVAMVGIERDPERVATAEVHARPGLSFRRGDFQLPVLAGERIRLLRALNVLRQYDEHAATAAHRQLIAQIDEGGLVVEGTCDPPGRTMVVALLRRRDQRVHSEGLLFATSLSSSFQPRDFQAVLPKHLIHRMLPGEPIHAFFDAWDRATKLTRGRAAFGVRQHFVAAAEALAQSVPGVVTRRSWLRNGWLLWPSAPYP